MKNVSFTHKKLGSFKGNIMDKDDDWMTISLITPVKMEDGIREAGEVITVHTHSITSPNFCKHCEQPYDKEEVKRINGSESAPYLLGYCSAQCYTKSVTRQE
jgi:hypothetical protein